MLQPLEMSAISQAAHALAVHGHHADALQKRIQSALAIVAAGEILPGRGRDHDRGYWAYIGGHGDTWHVPFEIAQAIPHHKTAQLSYSITRQKHGTLVEYDCTCTDARRATMQGGAPLVPGIGVCCKHVCAYLIMHATGRIQEA